jgi:hypothetical protein
LIALNTDDRTAQPVDDRGKRKFSLFVREDTLSSVSAQLELKELPQTDVIDGEGLDVEDVCADFEIFMKDAYSTNFHPLIHRPIVSTATGVLADSLNALLDGIPVEARPSEVVIELMPEPSGKLKAASEESSSHTAAAAAASAGGAEKKEANRFSRQPENVKDADPPEEGTTCGRIYTYFCHLVDAEKGKTKASEALTILPARDTATAKRALRCFLKAKREAINQNWVFPPPKAPEQVPPIEKKSTAPAEPEKAGGAEQEG